MAGPRASGHSLQGGHSDPSGILSQAGASCLVSVPRILDPGRLPPGTLSKVQTPFWLRQLGSEVAAVGGGGGQGCRPVSFRARGSPGPWPCPLAGGAPFMVSPSRLFLTIRSEFFLEGVLIQVLRSNLLCLLVFDGATPLSSSLVLLWLCSDGTGWRVAGCPFLSLVPWATSAAL